MRYPKPGSFVTAEWEGERTAELRSGPALVLGTSRHAIPFRGDITAALAEEWAGYDPDEAPVAGHRVDVWRSVTKAEIMNGGHDYCLIESHGPGDWCSAGNGDATVRVAFPVFGEELT